MRQPSFRVTALAGLLVLGLLAAACARGASAGTGGGGLSLRFASPGNGAQVSEPFKVTFDSSVPLGDPGTGRHHVHLCFDVSTCTANYTIVYGTSVMVSNLSPGTHTLVASLRNADHSDAGPSATIAVTVGSGGGTGSPSPASGGYGY